MIPPLHLLYYQKSGVRLVHPSRIEDAGYRPFPIHLIYRSQ